MNASLAMLKRRFPKVEILQGKLDGKGEKDLKLQEAIKGCDLFIRNSGMGQDLTFMQFCQKHGKPTVSSASRISPPWSRARARRSASRC
jgi:hypothetical protein